MADSFKFRKFEVNNVRSAQKVGTDGVLLGAWSEIPVGSRRILDIGTGTGVIALMMAQRCPDARIEAIDIDTPSVEESAGNFAASPWSERLSSAHVSLQDFARDEAAHNKYDLLISNPPFFDNSLKAPDERRTAARHSDSLSYVDIIDAALALLSDDGVISLVYPVEEAMDFISLAESRGLFLCRLCRVSSVSGRPPKRILMTLGKKRPEPQFETLDIRDGGDYSERYRTLLKEFYLFLF